MFDRKLMFALVPMLLFVIVVGCGRKGAPKPPEENAPSSVQFLTASGQVNAVVLSWTAPQETASGSELSDVESFVVQRRDVVGDKTGKFEDVGVVKVEPGTMMKKKQFSFSDSSIQPGHVYDYSVYAVRADGLEGETDKILRITFRGQTSTIEKENSENGGLISK